MSASDADQPNSTVDTPSSSPTTVVIIDPDGELVLRVGSGGTDGIRDFKVCSATLRRASPVFKAMLFGPWIESQPSRNFERQWVVSLPEDNLSAMRVILEIVHGNFDQVDIAGVIVDRRLYCIQELLDFFHAQVTAKTAPENACQHSDERCVAAILGQIWLGMLRNGRKGFSPANAEDVPEESIVSLLETLSKLFRFSLGYQGITGLPHRECTPEDALEEMEDRLRYDHEWWQSRLLRPQDRQHMARQR